MSDIAARAREWVRLFWDQDWAEACEIMLLQADEIERLRKEVDWLREQEAHITHEAALQEAEITRLRALTTPRPIETAPEEIKDGRLLLLFWNGRWRVGFYYTWGSRWDTFDRDYVMADAPTRWLPLLEDPK